MKTIKDLLDKHFSGLSIDKRLAKNLNAFKNKWVSSNSEMLGSGLLGNSNLYFKTTDQNALLSLFKVNSRDFRSDYKYIEAIEPKHKIASDVINLCLFYLAHRFSNSKLKDKDKDKAVYDCISLFNYRTLAALHSHRLPYLVSKQVAVTAYEDLSNRYMIKKLGTWVKYIDYRTLETLSIGPTGNDSPHKKTLITFTPDEAVLAMIADTQGRIRSTVNLYMDTLMNIKDTGAVISSESSGVVIENERSTIDMTNNVSDSLSRVMNRLENPDDFVDISIISVVSSMIPGSSPDLLADSLRYMAKKKSKLIKRFIENSILFMYRYLSENGHLVEHNDDLPYLVVKIRGAYTSSRTSDKDVLELREIGTKIAKSGSSKVNTQTIARIRTGIFVYLFILSFRATR